MRPLHAAAPQREQLPRTWLSVVRDSSFAMLDWNLVVMEMLIPGWIPH